MKCVLCGEAKFRNVYSDNRLTVIRCTKCGIVCQQDYERTLRSHSSHKDTESYYTERTTSAAVPSFSNRKVQLTEDIRREIVTGASPQSRVLDVGCGRGELLIELRKLGFQVFGLEPSSRLASYLTEEEQIPVIGRMYDAASFQANSFAVITFIQVLEHVVDPLETLRAAFTHLEPGGLLIIDVPSYNNPRVLAYRATKIKRLVYGDFVPVHNYYYTRQTLAKLVQTTGFDITNIVTGRYTVKTGVNNYLMRFVDFIANYFGVGGITLYARKSTD